MKQLWTAFASLVICRILPIPSPCLLRLCAASAKQGRLGARQFWKWKNVLILDFHSCPKNCGWPEKINCWDEKISFYPLCLRCTIWRFRSAGSQLLAIFCFTTYVEPGINRKIWRRVSLCCQLQEPMANHQQCVYDDDRFNRYGHHEKQGAWFWSIWCGLYGI